MIRLRQLTEGTPYAAYTYSYPHKTAYRPLAPPRRLEEVWNAEPKEALYLYVHVPFCEMRCGFCNLFTTANPREEVAEAYVAALWRQGRRVRDAISTATFARMAIGGGTPTFLSAGQLQGVLTLTRELFGVQGHHVPISVETSPRTAELDKLQLLRDFGVQRISIGVQSFVEAEVGASGRAQKNAWVESALERIRSLCFPELNLDLIYGLPGQTAKSWLVSLHAALRWWPEELYLYPLYVRPLTGLDRWGGQAEDQPRLSMYRLARDVLLTSGYAQVSMRMFRKIQRKSSLAWSGLMAQDYEKLTPVYCCQDDGMVGLGCGARSYTRTLHYSNEYAVGADGVREIIGGYIARPTDQFDWADHGCELDAHEQRRRWVIKSVLRAEGMNSADYRARFGTEPMQDLPELNELCQVGLLESTAGTLRPTPAGLERSDAIGPWLFSGVMRDRMEAFEPR